MKLYNSEKVRFKSDKKSLTVEKMLSFFSPSDPNYFIYVVKVTKISNEPEYNFVSIYQKDEKTAKNLNNQLGNFCFPFEHMPYQAKEGVSFSFAFTDEKKNYLYCFVHLREIDGVRHAYTVVTKYYHPSLFLEVAATVCEKFERNPSEATDYLSNLLHLQLIRRPHDWALTIKAGLDVKNVDHLSPDNEISKLLAFLFSRFSIQDILSTIVAILLDCRIIVISESLELLSRAIFAILGLIYPLQWQGTFIPLLPKIAATALEAPFGYLIGVHSTMASLLLQDSVDRYFALNVDCHYSVIIGMEDFPPEIMQLIDKTASTIKARLDEYKPIFPKHSIQKKIRKFILDVFDVAYGGCDTSGPSTLFKKFSVFRDTVSDDFSAIISQTQFTDVFMRQIMQDFDEDGDKEQQKALSLEVLKAFWPKQDFSKAQPQRRRRGGPTRPRERKAPPKIHENKGKVVGIQPKPASLTVHPLKKLLSLAPEMMEIDTQALFNMNDDSDEKDETVEVENANVNDIDKEETKI